MQIVPIRSREFARDRLVNLLDEESRWSILRAPLGFDKARMVQAWLNANPRRLASARWIEVVSDSRIDAATVTTLLAKEGRIRTLVLDATSAQHPLDLSTLRAMGARARHIVVIARSAQIVPDHVTALLDAQLIDAEALAYRTDEITEIAPGIDSVRATHLNEAAGGWPVLVRFAAQHQPQTSPELDRIVASFAKEQLNLLSPLGSQVFISTSVVRHPTLSLTAKLSGLGEDDARRGWADVVTFGFAEEDGAGRQAQWRVIPLVREAYLTQFRNDNPERVRELDQLAARWFAQHRQPVEAARHAIEAEDWVTVSDVIEEAAFTLFSEHPSAARDLIERIPSEALENNPLASMFGDLLTSSGEAELATSTVPRRVVGYLSLVSGDDELLVQQDIAGVNVEVRWREAMSRRLEGNFAGALAIQSAQDIRFRDPARPPLPTDRGLLPIVHLQYGVTLMLAGRFVDAESAFADAIQDGHPGFAALARRGAFGALAMLAGVEGDFVRAQDNLDRMRKCPRVIGFWSRAVRFVENVSESLINTAHLDIAEAGSALEGASKPAGNDEFWAFYLLARARHAVASGNAVAVLTEIVSIRRTRQRLAGPGSAASFLLPWAEAELLLAAGQAARAGEVLEAAPMHPLLTGIRVLQKVQVGDPADAIGLAGAALWGDDAGPAARGLGFLGRSVAELQLGLTDDAASSFRFAHKLIVEFENHRLLGLFPRKAIAALSALTGLSFEFSLESVPEMLPAPPVYVAMTERELVVLKHLTTGATLASIARTLFVSENTVRSQVRSLYRKLGVNSRDDALAEARRRGIYS